MEEGEETDNESQSSQDGGNKKIKRNRTTRKSLHRTKI